MITVKLKLSYLPVTLKLGLQGGTIERNGTEEYLGPQFNCCTSSVYSQHNHLILLLCLEPLHSNATLIGTDTEL